MKFKLFSIIFFCAILSLGFASSALADGFCASCENAVGDCAKICAACGAGNAPVCYCGDVDVDLLSQDACSSQPDSTTCLTYCKPTSSTAETAATPASEGGLNQTIQKLDSFLNKEPIKGELISGDVPTIAGKIIKALLGIIGSVALAMFVYGGIMYMTSGGAAEKASKARGTLVWSILGLIVVFSSYAIVSAIITPLTSGLGSVEKQRGDCLSDCQQMDTNGENHCLQEYNEPEQDEQYKDCMALLANDSKECRAKCQTQFQ
ncbi:MAG TPA: pilin [Candidatus Bipolaricaulota bacterium]|nr:pilin [Candidatus Bipolaricaulota bacterium]